MYSIKILRIAGFTFLYPDLYGIYIEWYYSFLMDAYRIYPYFIIPNTECFVFYFIGCDQTKKKEAIPRSEEYLNAYKIPQ